MYFHEHFTSSFTPVLVLHQKLILQDFSISQIYLFLLTRKLGFGNLRKIACMVKMVLLYGTVKDVIMWFHSMESETEFQGKCQVSTVLYSYCTSRENDLPLLRLKQSWTLVYKPMKLYAKLLRESNRINKFHQICPPHWRNSTALCHSFTFVS